MAELPLTETALIDYSASQQFMHGLHAGSEPRASIHGRNIGEVPYDPVVHQTVGPNPLSIWAQVTGVPHVKLNIPGHPLNANIIVHQPEPQALDYELGYGESRNWLIRKVGQSIADSMPGITDNVFTYAVGKHAELIDDPDVEVLDTDGSPEDEARAVADICTRGLSFVISDYLNLPLDIVKSCNFPEAIAIKANVPSDLTIVKAGVIERSGVQAGEIDAFNDEQRSYNNQILARHDARIKTRLQESGLHVASVVLDPQVTSGYKVERLDTEIAGAINQLAAEQA